MSLRRGGAKLRALSKAHSPLHVLLWQTRETERTLLASAAAQKTLFSDLATWASAENRALSDVCSNFSELNTLATAAQAKLAQVYKSFRKDMAMILEGEKRADVAQRKLQEAEGKRHKVRRLVLQAQNRTQITAENLPSSEYASLQTQLAETERIAERAHITACETKSESEAVKLVIVRSTLSKLSQSHLAYAHQVQTIYQGGQEIVMEIPDPPPPGDLLSCIRYTGFESTRNTLAQVKTQVQILSSSPNRNAFASTPLVSPIAATSSSSSPLGRWTSVSPSAPENPFLTSETDLPPPYNTSFHSPQSIQNGSWSYVHHRNNSFSGRRSISTAPANPNTTSTVTQIQPGHNNGISLALSPPSVSCPQSQDLENPNHSGGGRY